jgi:hypothetical protein
MEIREKGGYVPRGCSRRRDGHGIFRVVTVSIRGIDWNVPSIPRALT